MVPGNCCIRYDGLFASGPADLASTHHCAGQRGVSEWLLGELRAVLKDAGVKLPSLEDFFHPCYDACVQNPIA